MYLVHPNPDDYSRRDKRNLPKLTLSDTLPIEYSVYCLVTQYLVVGTELLSLSLCVCALLYTPSLTHLVIRITLASMYSVPMYPCIPSTHY